MDGGTVNATLRDGRRSVSASKEFRLEDFLPFQLAVAANRVSRLCAREYAAQSGLSLPEWRVLVMIARFGTVSPSVVSERANMDKVKVSRAAATLVARGLVKQSQDPSDGRGRILRLTKKGTSVYENLVPVARGIEARIAQGLSRTELASLQKVLLRLNAFMAGTEEEDEAGLDG